MEYQEKVLQIFNLDEYNNEILTEAVTALYNKVKETPRYKDIHPKLMEKANLLLSDDPVIGFMIYYSYDTIDVFHRYIEVCLNGTDQEWERIQSSLN